MFSSHVQFWTDGRTDRQTERQTETRADKHANPPPHTHTQPVTGDHSFKYSCFPI